MTVREKLSVIIKTVIQTSSVEGNNEMISSFAQGILVPRADPTALAKAMFDIIRHPDLAQKLGRDARSHVLKRYSLEAYAGECQKIFQGRKNTLSE